MKRNYVKILLIIGILFTMSCSKDEKGYSELILSEKVITFDAKSTEKSISVIADEEWEAVGTNWIETKKEGKNLKIKVRANKTALSREGAVSVKAGNAVAFVKVVQSGIKGNSELTLSEKEMTFDAQAAEKSITVITDKEWVAIGTDWIETKKEGKNLKIKVKANKTLSAREGAVSVKAGNSVAFVKVVQTGLKGNVVLSTENLRVSDDKGESLIEVIANAKEWTASSDVSWLKVVAKPHRSELLISYTQNEETEDREGVITITVGDVGKTFTVTQLGRLFFFVPYLDFEGTREQIIEFEESRINKLTANTPERLSYETRSKEIFRRMYYKFKDNEYYECLIYAKDANTMINNLDGFKKFLEEKGFEQEGEFVFFNSKYSVRAKIDIQRTYGMATVTYKAVPKQDKAYPTFKKFPYISELPWLSTNKQIIDWEGNNGGVFDEKKSKINNPDPEIVFDILVFNVTSSDDEVPFSRAYTVGKKDNKKYKEGLLMKQYWFSKTSLVFYEMSAGVFAPTREFLALAKKEGFTYKGGPDDRGYYTFTNMNKSIILVVRVGTVKGKKVLDFVLMSPDPRASSQTAFTSSYFNFENFIE